MRKSTLINVGGSFSRSRLFWGMIKLLAHRKSLLRFIGRKSGLQKFRITCVQIHITNQCDLNCMYCYAKKHIGPSLSKSKILSLINDARHLGVHEVQLVGGEPLLSKHFKTFIKAVSKLGMNLRIYTNGLLLTDHWISVLKDYSNVMLAVKFDSPNGYKSHIGYDYHDRVSEAISKCVVAGIYCNTFITVTKKNISDIEFLVSRSFELNALPIIERYLPACSQETNESLELSPVEWNKVLSIFEKGHRKLMPFYQVVSRLLGFYCSCYKSTLSIDTNGEVLPCPYAPKELSIGSVQSLSLVQLFKEFERKVLEWNKVPEDCQSCQERDICRGGCKTYTFLKERKFFKQDKYCLGKPPNQTMSSFNNPLVKRTK